MIVDIAHRIEPGARFFYLDTELLFPETYATRDALAEHYGIEFDRYAGITLAEQAERHGANLWRRDPDACCGIRKVEAMREALDGVECWVSGVRRVDSETRATAAEVRLGQAVRALEAEPAGGLGRQASLEPHQGAPRAVQPTS